jgi:hypothetical protein
MLEHTDIRKKIELYFVGILILVSVFYGIWRAYPLLSGATITIYNPGDGDTVASTTFEISGKVSKVKEITLQGRLIPIETDGHFREILMAQEPYTTIIITATDFYGATVSKTLHVTPEH